jgi:hypothetical protein
MPAKEKLQTLIYNYFFEQYEEETIAEEQAENLSNEILSLMKDIDYSILKRDMGMLTKASHTLKHLLLYADLDDVSDMCQELESDARKGIIKTPLKEEIFQEIVK